MLMKRAFKFKDPFILKMLRNISQHDELELKMKFVVCYCHLIYLDLFVCFTGLVTAISVNKMK